MDTSKQGNMIGAAVVLGLSVGIGADLTYAEEATQITAKSTSTNPQVFKFAVDNKNPGAQPNAIKFDGVDGESAKQKPAGANSAPQNAYKVTFEDVLISSAKGENPAPAATQGALDPNAQPRGEKFDPKPRNNARRMHKP
jgi:hypothetical protein